MPFKSYIPSVMTEDIVISGMSGRFPESDNIDEFAHNLFNKTDLFTEDDRRWPTGLLYSFLHPIQKRLEYIVPCFPAYKTLWGISRTRCISRT